MKPFMNRETPPWVLNFHSLYSVREWFKLLGYEQSYKNTASFMPIVSRAFSKYLTKINIIQKILAKDYHSITLLQGNLDTSPWKWLIVRIPK